MQRSYRYCYIDALLEREQNGWMYIYIYIYIFVISHFLKIILSSGQMFFQRSLSDIKFPQVSRTLLSIHVDFSCPVCQDGLNSLLDFQFTSISFSDLWRMIQMPELQFVSLSLSRREVPVVLGRCLWCNGYRRRKWTRQYDFKSWMRLIAFHIALIPLGKVWIQLFSLQLWVNSRKDRLGSSALGRQLV